MTIIVLLILAGVSLNAIIGDNGILTSAMDAKMKNGMAILEEFLQEKYVEFYDESNNYNSKLSLMTGLPQTRKYFQKASNNEYHFLDSNSYKEYFFIEKSELPKDIKDVLTSGNNSLTGKTIYAEFNDIYGITEDLKIYYCSNGYSSWFGAADTAKVTNLDEVVFEKDSTWAKALESDKDVTLADLRIDSLKISDSNLDLTKLEKFGSLTTISINGSFASLDGFELAPNLKYIYIYNDSVIDDYSSLGKMKLLNQLYFINPIGSEFEKFCDTNRESEFPNLEYLSLSSGDQRYCFSSKCEGISDYKNQNLTTLEPLSWLSEDFKATLKYLCIDCSSISSLDSLESFSNLRLINARSCMLTTLSGIRSSKLISLCVDKNLLGQGLEKKDTLNPSVDSLSYLCEVKSLSSNEFQFFPRTNNLSYISLTGNSDLIWVNYLSCFSKLENVFLKDCMNLKSDSVINIRDFLASREYSIDQKYNLLFLNKNSTVIDLKNQSVEYTVFESLKTYDKVYDMNLEGVTITGNNGDINTCINDLLTNLPNIKFLCVKNQPNLTDFSFLKNLTQLVYLDCRDSGANTDDEFSESNLKLLNSISTIKGLAINNPNIDLVKIQDAINNFGYSYKGEASSFSNGQGFGLVDTDATSLKTLENCINLTAVNLNSRGLGDLYNRLEMVLNLSRLTSVKYYTGLYFRPTKVILPPNLTYFYTMGNSGDIDFSNCGKLEELRACNSGGNTYMNLNGIRDVQFLTYISVTGRMGRR